MSPIFFVYYLDHSQFFEAFQFGFGCDTSAKQASVRLILHKNGKKLHFSHSKAVDSTHTYSIKIEGIDEHFRVNENPFIVLDKN